MTRQEIHDTAEAHWHIGGRTKTLVLGTGVGKSKVAINILRTLMECGALTMKSKILLLVSDTNLRDTSWTAEFIKWKAEELWPLVRAECYQTAYRWRNEEYDLVIADEIDFAISEKYSEAFTENKYGMILGLTGFVEADKMPLLETIAPVTFKFTTNDAQAAGILNEVHLVGVDFKLSPIKNIKIEYKTSAGEAASFMSSENDQYAFIHEQCDKYYGQKVMLDRKIAESFILDPVDVKRYDSADSSWGYWTKKRSAFLNTCNSSAIAAKKLTDMILEKSATAKMLVFSVRKAQSAKVCKYTYNSDSSIIQKAKLLSDINSGEIRRLGLCKALDRGANLEGINVIVMESYNSSKTSFQQRHGRGCRLNPEEMLYLYVLVPYFVKKVKGAETDAYGYVTMPTQSRKWAMAMTTGFVAAKTSTMNLEI